MKRRQYLLLITLIVIVGFADAVAQEPGPGTETLPKDEEGNGAVSSVLLTVLGAILGFLAKAFWDYCMLNLKRRGEVQKLSLDRLFDFARKYYFGIAFYAMDLVGGIEAVQESVADGTDQADDKRLKAFYNLTQYRREIAKFVAEDSGAWFLTRRRAEEEVTLLDLTLEELLPFSSAEDSYLGHVVSEEDWKAIPLYRFQECVEQDEKLKGYYTRFIKWIEQGGDDAKEFKESLRKLSDALIDELNLAFADWYKSVPRRYVFRGR